jgi:hypothetical protein
MRTKVSVNLSTDDPLEAELLDMLATIKSTHRRQERLRSLLKAGFNLFYKNMAPERAMSEAFDKTDVALILSLFGKDGAGSKRNEALAPVDENFESKKPIANDYVAPPRPVYVHDHEQEPKPIAKVPRKAYREVTGVLEVTSDDDLVDVDPDLFETSNNVDEDTKIVLRDPLSVMFGSRK